MKSKLFAILLISLLGSFAVSAQSTAPETSPVGKWKFEAPYAPEGFTTGLVDISLTDNKYSAAMSFTGSDYKFNGEKVKFEKDTFTFSIYIEGQDITVTLKLTDPAKMTGKAVYSEGEIPLTMTRTATGK